MKKVALFGFLLALLFTTTTVAAYPLTVSTTENSLTAKIANAPVTGSFFQIFILKKEFPAGPFTTAISLQKDSAVPSDPIQDKTKQPVLLDGTVNWSIPELVPQTTYYVRVVETRGGKSTYATDSQTVATKPATITPGTLIVDSSEGNGSALITGTIDTTKNPHYRRYTIELQYSQEPISENYPTRYSVYPGHTPGSTTPGINGRGEYHLFIPTNLTPSARYNLREIITYGGTQKVTDGSFVVGGAYTPSTAVGAIQSDFENRSYRLLAPFPGLSVLFDPDLCQEQVALGKPVFGGSCDDQVSAFINLGLKILIGAAAVLLVLRIMFEGYKYITTDIPRLLVSAKSGLWDAVLGLVLALSSFLILNTINPKLIENTVNIQRLEIGIEELLEYEAIEITSTGVSKKVGKVSYESTYKNSEVCLEPAARAGKVPPCGKIETIPVQAKGSYVEKLFSDKLKKLGNSIKTAGLSMTITEAMPSSRTHKNECHKNGRCVDIDFTGNQKPDANTINSFIKITNQLGMCAVWEATPTEGKGYYDSLAGKVLRMEQWANVQHANGAHFSLYNGTCK
ncbi:MAG: hypothetical protein ACOYMZ_01290 [Minisyncoccia bacterium]